MLVDGFIETVRRSPSAPAVSDTIRSLSFRQLARLAVVLRDEVRRQTDCPRVGIMLPASTAFPACLFGVLWGGRTAIPLNFLLNPEELEGVVRSAEIDLIITVRPFEKVAEGLSARAVFLEDLPIKRRMLWATLRGLPRVPSSAPDDTAVILFTSGTTAQPKGVELTQNNLHSNCVDSIFTLKMVPQLSFLNVLPPFHVFGLTGCVLIPALLGAAVHAIPRFNPAALVRTVRKENIAVMMAVPSMYAAVLKTKSAKPNAFRSVYLAVSGGEPLPDTVRDQFAARFDVPLRQGYGLTETSPVLTCCSRDEYRDGTVGRAIRGVEIKIVDEHGATLGPDTDGEILVRGPGVMKGYYKKPEETARVIDADGWFHTGDIGLLDKDGFLKITGRAKDMLIIGGENVFPREIESVLEAHEDVIQAAVIGVPDELRGETPVAFVIPREGADLSDQALRGFAKQALAGFKVPKRVVIREDLPVGPTGKILKRRLRDLL